MQDLAVSPRGGTCCRWAQCVSMNDLNYGEVLVGLTTYAGNFETRAILLKILRHFRARNGSDVKLLIISDGPIVDVRVYRYADYVLCRPGPSGLQQGEYDNLRLLADFANGAGYRYVIKTCGDVVINKPNWVATSIAYLKEKGKRLLSTHWFRHNSWIVGTKFFVSEAAFLHKIFPQKITDDCLEENFTENIRRHVILEDTVHLINSTTGEAHEVEAELREWQWEHAHSLHKFRHLDDVAPSFERFFHHYFLYPVLRISTPL
jgi:hypothetical protein